ncbi:MAG: hypothetical protein ACK5N0_05310 [Synechococcaceae cyanobacterium]
MDLLASLLPTVCEFAHLVDDSSIHVESLHWISSGNADYAIIGLQHAVFIWLQKGFGLVDK